MTPDRRPQAPTTDLIRAHAAEAAQLLKALGNEQRLHILCNLIGGPLSVGELNARIELSQSALSQHLGLLRELGLVATRREAQTIYYSLPGGPVLRVMALLQEIYCTPDPASSGGADAGRALCDG
jgi:ArsR family transcriptional regulator, virulence genes transcriptional regulator